MLVLTPAAQLSLTGSGKGNAPYTLSYSSVQEGRRIWELWGAEPVKEAWDAGALGKLVLLGVREKGAGLPLLT